MSTFKTSIRLKDAGIQDYERLDAQMETEAFVRTGGGPAALVAGGAESPVVGIAGTSVGGFGFPGWGY